jgi:hypothetical protein
MSVAELAATGSWSTGEFQMSFAGKTLQGPIAGWAFTTLAAVIKIRTSYRTDTSLQSNGKVRLKAISNSPQL